MCIISQHVTGFKCTYLHLYYRKPSPNSSPILSPVVQKVLQKMQNYYCQLFKNNNKMFGQCVTLYYLYIIKQHKNTKNKMETLRTLQTKNFNYKGVEISMVDTIESGYSTFSCFPKRTWTANGNEAFTVKINGSIKLASYLENAASNGGERTVFIDFVPECGFYLHENEVKDIIEGMGMYVEHMITETDF